jgi:DNA primase
MISKDTITLVRDRTDLAAVVSESVPSLKKRGRRFVGLCPFHKEKTPSFHVNPDTGLYHCFGCKESGDVFGFLERVEGYTFVEAVRALAERAGIPIDEERGAAPSDADRHKKGSCESTHSGRMPSRSSPDAISTPRMTQCRLSA